MCERFFCSFVFDFIVSTTRKPDEDNKRGCCDYNFDTFQTSSRTSAMYKVLIDPYRGFVNYELLFDGTCCVRRVNRRVPRCLRRALHFFACNISRLSDMDLLTSSRKEGLIQFASRCWPDFSQPWYRNNCTDWLHCNIVNRQSSIIFACRHAAQCLRRRARPTQPPPPHSRGDFRWASTINKD